MSPQDVACAARFALRSGDIRFESASPPRHGLQAQNLPRGEDLPQHNACRQKRQIGRILQNNKN